MKSAFSALSCLLLGLLASACGEADTNSANPIPSPEALTTVVEDLHSELEAVRKTRDAIQHDLDVMTRERVDVDGELTRLRKEKATLEEQLQQARQRLRDQETGER